MSETEETILEGMWDCPNCESANKGSAMKCEGCGSVRDEDVKFYLPENAQEVTDQAEIAAANAGADWICGFCSTSNNTAATDCKQCGGPRDEGTEQKAEEYKPAGAASASPTPPPPAEEGKGGGGMPVALIGGIVALILLSCCCLWWVFLKKTTEVMTVAKTEWVRELPRSEMRWVNETSETYPKSFGTSKLRNIVRGPIKVTKTVPEKKQVTTTKTINLKNGKFKKVKETKWVTKNVTKTVSVQGYLYQREKLVKLKSLYKRGAPDVTPSDPKRTTGSGMSFNRVRYGRVLTHYEVTFKGKKAGSDPVVLSSKDNKELAPSSIEELKTKYPLKSEWKVTYSGTGVSKVEKP
ncbi:MAG: zinc finger Ran-binding domain-containing protein [Planctomycetota bacterium]|nr:zinc finger Ran-binding domain-containing protein [Planctomycetota bacterium]